jgi:hypothetical protein
LNGHKNRNGYFCREGAKQKILATCLLAEFEGRVLSRKFFKMTILQQSMTENNAYNTDIITRTVRDIPKTKLTFAGMNSSLVVEVVDDIKEWLS